VNKLLFLSALLAGFSTFAAASVPTVQSFSTSPIYLGSAATLSSNVADSGGGLVHVTFSASGPGLTGWQNVGDVAVTGSQANAQVTWAPVIPGLYTVEVSVFNADPNNPAIAYQFQEVLAGTRSLVPFTIANGMSQLLAYEGEFVTATDTASYSTSVKSGGTLILWSGGRIKLEPGFHAESGSFFWAAVDHNLNGYSDIEETQQHFIPGVPDAWLADQALTDPGINLSQSVSSWAYSSAQLQAAYQGGYKSTDIASVTKQNTGNYPLVLATPAGFLGVQTDTWSIASAQ